jgi:hypothetical protein
MSGLVKYVKSIKRSIRNGKPGVNSDSYSGLHVIPGDICYFTQKSVPGDTAHFLKIITDFSMKISYLG